jgi:hypothetical protein
MADNRDRTNQGMAPAQSGQQQSDRRQSDQDDATKRPAGGQDLGDQADSPTSTERSTSNKAQGVR